uniref:RNA-dependent RNA polymerase n=1 Tax=Grapevine-associated mitovirus 15 TaxID=2814307 RepID=A0A8F5RCT7_9VIRU|nr:MAG: RNA-dependent RNA polymerase [Grapevine-associated mitovirus 15]
MKVLGVGIGLHKSLLSRNATAMEFCKRTFWHGVDVSPVRFLELQSAFSQPAAAVEFIKKYNMTWQAFVKAAGYKYRVLGGLNRPFRSLNSKLRLLILAVNVPYTAEDITSFFSIGIPKNYAFAFETLEVMQVLVDSEFKRIKKAINALLASSFQLEGKVLHLRDAANEILQAIPEGTIKVPAELAEDLRWAESLVEDRYADWVKGEGFVMQPVNLGPFALFEAELTYADTEMDPKRLVETVQNLIDRHKLGVLEGYLKPLEILVQGKPMEVIKTTAMELNRKTIHIMLNKYDMSTAEVWQCLIDIQKELGALPISQVKYQRLIDDRGRGFTEGMHIRLWKSLSTVSRTRVGVTPNPVNSSPVKTGGYLWF